MKNFNFDRIFGNSNNSKSASKASQKRKGRSARIEELEGREMLDGAMGAMFAAALDNDDCTTKYDLVAPQQVSLPPFHVVVEESVPFDTFVEATATTFELKGGTDGVAGTKTTGAITVAGVVFGFETTANAATSKGCLYKLLFVDASFMS